MWHRMRRLVLGGLAASLFLLSVPAPSQARWVFVPAQGWVWVPSPFGAWGNPGYGWYHHRYWHHYGQLGHYHWYRR